MSGLKASTKTVYGKDLKPGDQMKTWHYTERFEQVMKIGAYRTQTFTNGEIHNLATAYCTNGYNITIFLDLNDVEVLTSE